jgi:GntR family transcriptional regulator/MocR family aminotransferase
LADWARRTGGLLVEDDYDGEYRYDREPVGALQGLAPASTVYLGTASKTLAPGLRLGWLAAPPALIAPLVRQRRLTDRHTGILEQLTFAELIRSGRYDRHVRRSRTTYRRRRDDLVAALPPGLPVTGIAAGLHLLVGLPAGVSESALVGAARRRSLGLEGLSEHYGRSGRRPPQLVIGYGTPPDHAFRPALRALVDLLHEYPSR